MTDAGPGSSWRQARQSGQGPGDYAARQALTPAVCTTLKEQVMKLTISPDTRINIGKLARELHVSNTPLRGALTQLEAEGW